MKLKELLKFVSAHKIYGESDIDIKGISENSRSVKKGFVFVAISGLTVDGHNFITKAIDSGAVAIVGQKDLRKVKVKKEITYIKVPDSRKTLGVMASAFYKEPSKKLKVIGVTGTDGKTTTTSLIYHLLSEGGKKAGMVSSVSAKIGDNEIDTGFHVTNPDPVSLQKYLSEMVKLGCEYAVLEVTSHGLDQERVEGVSFDCGVLTNITHEHLDYHKTYKNYLATKAKLFKDVRVAILNKTDKSFKMVSALIPYQVKIIPYDLETLKGNLKNAVLNRFPEEYNRLNAIAAILVAMHFGVKNYDIVRAIKSFPGVSGRLEEIKNKKELKIFVDFAHTPNALENVLRSLRNRLSGDARLIAVFGCAGERDIRKRPMMGEISGKLADVSVFTAEDPRTEDVNMILNKMVVGARKSKAEEHIINSDINRLNESIHRYKRHYFVRIPERGEAISFAIHKIAKKGDIIVICGKGHEKSMAYNGVEYPWSDQEAVKVALKGGIKRILRKEL